MWHGARDARKALHLGNRPMELVGQCGVVRRICSIRAHEAAVIPEAIVLGCVEPRPKVFAKQTQVSDDRARAVKLARRRDEQDGAVLAPEPSDISLLASAPFGLRADISVGATFHDPADLPAEPPYRCPGCSEWF